MEREAPATESPGREATEQTGLDSDGARQTEDARRATGLAERSGADADGPTAVDGGGQPRDTADGEPKIEVIDPDSETRGLLSQIVPEIVLLVAAAYLFYLAGDFGGQAEPGQLGPSFWPRMAAGGMAIALVVSIFQTVRAHRRPVVKVQSRLEEEDSTLEAPTDPLRAAIAMALVIGYVFSTMFLGYLIATAVFLTTFIWVGGQRRWYVPLIASAGSLISTALFIGIVYVDLPTGVGLFDSVTVAIYRLLGLQ
jgi:putative tricarboxylic transport membrane protein